MVYLYAYNRMARPILLKVMPAVDGKYQMNSLWDDSRK